MQDSGSYPWSLQARGEARHYTTNYTRKYSAGEWRTDWSEKRDFHKTRKADEGWTRGEDRLCT